MMHKVTGFDLVTWGLLILVLLLQSTYLFVDARRRGHNKWFWGIWGLIQLPMPTLFYFIVARKIYKKIWGR